MIDIKEKEKCCGCFACKNICPNNAIIMQEDEKGFKYPQIDKNKCINCGLCDKICPILNSKKEQEKTIEAYACYNKNEVERVKSSSGGIFILISKEIIKQNGVVFGASFDESFNVHHTYAETQEDLEKFMGAKYVQSNINDTFKKVKEFLEGKRIVLFSGTPCQIEGLKKYLGKEYENLYTQDIICHGVPSPLVWNKYKEYREEQEKEKIKNISFRNKESGWNSYKLKINFNKKVYKNTPKNDDYMKAFLRNTSLRDSCYKCNFKKKYRESDITLADFWGIENIHKEFSDNKGTSLVILHSKKGIELFETIKDNLKYEKTNLDEAIKYNLSMIKSSTPDKNREEFFNNLNQMNFRKLVKKYTNHKNIIIRIVKKIWK